MSHSVLVGLAPGSLKELVNFTATISQQTMFFSNPVEKPVAAERVSIQYGRVYPLLYGEGNLHVNVKSPSYSM